MSAIEDKHRALGGDAGPLGKPTGKEGPAAVDDWSKRSYEHGIVLSNDVGGSAYAVYGVIFERYKKEGLEKFGLPFTDELRTPRHDGRISWFAMGGKAITWQPGSPARVVLGDIATTWRRYGSIFGPLGLPIGEETAHPLGQHQDFTGGSIYWRRSTKRSCAMFGLILSKWQSLGGPQSNLEWPLSHELDAEAPGHRYTRFITAILEWSPEHGVEVVT